MPRLTARFTEEHPDIELVFTDFVTFEDFERALVEGKIDVVMTFGNSRRRKSCFCSTAIPWGSAFEWWAPNYETLAHVPFTPPPGVDDRVSVELSTNQPDSPAVQALYRCARDICANELQFGC